MIASSPNEQFSPLDLTPYSDSHPPDLNPPPFCHQLCQHTVGTLASQHSHLKGAKPGLINGAVMEGAVVGLTYPLDTREAGRSLRGSFLACPARRQQHLPGRLCPCREGGYAAERPCCRDTQTGVKDGEEEPCLLLCPCWNLNHSSKHSAPCTACNAILQGVEVCRQREGSRASVENNEDLGGEATAPPPCKQGAYLCRYTLHTSTLTQTHLC